MGFYQSGNEVTFKKLNFSDLELSYMLSEWNMESRPNIGSDS